MSRKEKEAFQFKELDLEGMGSLEAISIASRFNNWMYETIAKNFAGNVLEIGSGIGNISKQFIADGRNIHLTDLRKNYCNYLRTEFGKNPKVLGIDEMDIVHPDFDTIFADKLGQFDGVFALNVVEHIKEDQLAIINCKKLLKPGGRLVILVPAYQFLFNQFDVALEHYKRYNRRELIALFKGADLKIARSQYFNFIGIFGWFFTGSILRKKVIPTGQMKIYNTLVPIFKIIDKIIMNNMGLSVIVEGVKES